MADPRHMLHLARRLREDAQARDWDALARTSQELTAVLTPLSADQLRAPAERQALRELQQAHQQAHALCNTAALELQHALEELRTHKDGWMAYAAHGEMSEMSEMNGPTT